MIIKKTYKQNLPLIFAIIKKAFRGFLLRKDPLSIGLSSGLLVSTIAMLFISIAAESFLVVKINEVYWVFTAVTMASLSCTLSCKVENDE